VGLDAIVLDSADDCAGWCGPGVVAICAWQRELWDWWSADMVQEHRPILDALEVECVPIEQSVGHQDFVEDLAALGVRVGSERPRSVGCSSCLQQSRRLPATEN